MPISANFDSSHSHELLYSSIPVIYKSRGTMSSVQRAFAQKLSKQNAADVRRQIASSTSYSRDLSKSGSSLSGFSSTVS